MKRFLTATGVVVATLLVLGGAAALAMALTSRDAVPSASRPQAMPRLAAAPAAGQFAPLLLSAIPQVPAPVAAVARPAQKPAAAKPARPSTKKVPPAPAPAPKIDSATTAANEPAVVGEVKASPPPAPAPEPTPVVESGSETGELLFEASGTSDFVSPEFTAEGEWTLEYSYDCSNTGGESDFYLWVDEDDMPEVQAFGMQESGTGHFSAGTYQLEILTDCDWHVKAFA